VEHRTEEDAVNEIIDGFQKMSEREIVIAPWLVYQGEGRLSSELRKEMEKSAYELSIFERNAKVFWIPSLDVTPAFLQRAFFETLLSTAAYLSYMRLGTLIVTEEMVLVAERLVKKYIDEFGSSLLLAIYSRVMAYLNTQLLRYYGRVEENIFLTGKWHRPWINYTIDNELENGLRYKYYQIVEENGTSFVQLTPEGEKLHESCRRDLDICGFIRQREQLIRASNFTNMDDYESIVHHMNPELHNMRRHLIQWSGIHSGMKVLELGCGSGALTLDDGLYLAVGESGSIIATDPSRGMLERAKLKLSRFDADNVKFQQAFAESIPFPDSTFDAVIGMLFLQFTDIPAALEEIRRVTKDSGIFTTLMVLEVPRNDAFLAEWFEPIFKKGLQADSSVKLPNAEVLPAIAGKYLQDCSFRVQVWPSTLEDVESAVKFLVEAGTMAELSELPLQARSVLFQELIERGYAVREKYGPDNLLLRQPAQWFKGTVRK